MDISKSFAKMIEMGEKRTTGGVLFTKSSSKKRPVNSLIYLEREKIDSLTGILIRSVKYIVDVLSHLTAMTWLASLTR